MRFPGFLSQKKAKPPIEPSRILVLVDFENIKIESTGFNFLEQLDYILKKISREEAGEITQVFVFIPPGSAITYGETLHKMMFRIMLCPRIMNKAKTEAVDTVDQTMIDFGKWLLSQTQGVTHLCVAGGDQDFRFLFREGLLRGLKILAIAGSVDSLSAETAKLVDKTYYLSEGKP